MNLASKHIHSVLSRVYTSKKLMDRRLWRHRLLGFPHGQRTSQYSKAYPEHAQQILEKPRVHSIGHSFGLIYLKLCQNINLYKV